MSRLKEWMNEIIGHKNLIFLSLLFLVMAITLNSVSGNYVEKKISPSVPDLILDSIPTLDLDFLYVYGYSLIIIILFAYPLFFKVRELHVAISQFSLLILIRSFFVSLTHLNSPADSLIYTAPKLFILFDFKNALFFSGHTAVPFLGFLLFKEPKLKIFFLASTIILASTVLFMHVHYSIDVFAALFITYGSFKIGEKMFRSVKEDKI